MDRILPLRAVPLSLLALTLLTPAALAQRATTLGGYGEVHYVDSSGAERPARATVKRFVLFVGHQFNDRLALRSELEVEDARLEGGEPGGEIALEQTFIDYRLGGGATLRAGLVLVPLGILNETHEPNTFNGVARPLYHRVVLPTTWREIGVGVVGTLPAAGLAYRVYLVNGLSAAGLDDAEGIRGGRGEGGDAGFSSAAIAGRIEYGRPGLKVGAAAYHGGSADTVRALGTGPFAAPITVLALDFQYQRGPLALRGEGAVVEVPEAERVNELFGNGVGRRIGGWYVEGGFDVLSLVARSAERVIGFARYEWADTQATPAGSSDRDPSLRRRVTTVGLTYKPVGEVAFKGDLAWLRSGDGSRDRVLSLGLGYQF